MTTKNAGEKEQGMSEGPYKVGYQRGYHTVIDGSGVIVYSDDTSGGVNMFADAANYAHAHATAAAARRVRELEEACRDAVNTLDQLEASLFAKVAPSHVAYISKESASNCAGVLAQSLRAALAGKE